MFKTMDRGSYEKLSIRDSARSLKKYGSTSKHVMKNENYIKHYVSNADTLQGIALRYDVTIEQIRRVNRLWASDSLFLKEFLLIPASDNNFATSPSSVINSSYDKSNSTSKSPDGGPSSSSSSRVVSSPGLGGSHQVTSPTSPQASTAASFSGSSFDEESTIDDFLGKIDASIASTKEVVRKTQHQSEFASNPDLYGVDRRKPAVSRMKQQTVLNNNGTSTTTSMVSDLFAAAPPLPPPSAPQAVVVQQGKKVKSSLRQHERQQEELFEL